MRDRKENKDRKMRKSDKRMGNRRKERVGERKIQFLGVKKRGNRRRYKAKERGTMYEGEKERKKRKVCKADIVYEI
jgi:hypothetical protein